MYAIKDFRPVLGGFGIASRALYLAITAQAAIAVALIAIRGALS